MMNREISYIRNATGSYMKIPISRINEFDEKLMLRKKLPGLIPMERCYINGQGEYWYQISGKQSLDTYCKITPVTKDFVEKVILSVCSEIEILEMNLFDTNCLQMEPELIYVSNISHEILFCTYPENQQSMAFGFQQLMEYLLTKLDHKDESSVRETYEIYEKTLEEGYSILDLRDFIIQKRDAKAEALEEMNSKKEASRESFTKEPRWKNPRSREENSKEPRWKSTRIREENSKELKWKNSRSKEEFPNENKLGKSKKGRNGENEKYNSELTNEKNGEFITLLENPDILSELWKLIQNQLQAFKEMLSKRTERDELDTLEDWTVSPDEEEIRPQIEIHPTVCIGARGNAPEGLLLYEGAEGYQDIKIQRETNLIGKGADVDLVIPKETISRHHAKIKKEKDGYYLEDINSMNGTFLNEQMLNYKEKMKLQSGDLVRFADVKYRFL